MLVEVEIGLHYFLQVFVDVVGLNLTMLSHVVEDLCRVDEVHVYIVEIVEHNVAPINKLVKLISAIAWKCSVALVQQEQSVDHIDVDTFR